MTGFSESETVYQWRTQSTIEAVKNVFASFAAKASQVDNGTYLLPMGNAPFNNHAEKV